MNQGSSKKPYRIVITGGAGFLGSHLCNNLIQMGHEVICIDNLITGNPDNVVNLMGNKRFRFIDHDVTNFIHIEGQVDAIMHFASPASPADYLEFPIQTLKVGALGTHKTLGLAKAKGARYLLASTSEVYGDPLLSPQSEDYWGNVNPVGPRGVYDEAKRFAEAMTMAYHRYHGLDTRIARIFNTYGPSMRPTDGRVVSNFIVQALTGRPLTVYGDGSQTRSFCYISDMVDGITKLLFAESNNTYGEPETIEESIYSPINLGNPQELSVLEIAKMVLNLTESKSTIEFKPLPEDDPRVRRPNINKARTLLGWEPKVDIKEGLSMTIRYFKDKLSAKAF
ncbi:MAG: NAD-dependent dehydratase [Candidatus Dadabacteria bacterium]